MVKLYTNALKAGITLLLLIYGLFPNKVHAQSIQGKKFYYSMQTDLGGSQSIDGTYRLYFTGYYDDTIYVSYPARPSVPVIAVPLTGGSYAVYDPNRDYIDDIEDADPSPVGRNGILVTSKQPIGMYAITYVASSSEVCTVYPVDMIGTDYIAQSYREITYDGTDFNSRIALVGTQNNTNISITLPNYTWTSTPQYALNRAPGSTWNITLNEGETYSFINNYYNQAMGTPGPAPVSGPAPTSPPLPRPYTIGNNLGLNGVRITSTNNKKFVTIGGADCARIGDNDYGGCSACDVTFSQILPINTKNKRFITTNTLLRSNNVVALPGNVNASIADYLFMVASEDNTKITITGVANATKTIQKNEHWLYESPGSSIDPGRPGRADHVIVADKPIHLVQLEKGFYCDNTFGGDPSQMTVPPEYLWKNNYIAVIPTDAPAVYTSNFLTIIAKDPATAGSTARSSIVISLTTATGAVNIPVGNNWTRYGTTEPYYWNRLVLPSAGVLKIKGDSAFAFYCSGTAAIGSYGFVGGPSCSMKVIGGDPLRTNVANVCNGDSNALVIDKIIDGQIVRTNVLTQLAPVINWWVDRNKNGIFKEAADGAAIPPGNPSFVRMAQAGTYNVLVEVTDVAGCFARDTFQIKTISDIPTPSIVGPNAICNGDSVSLLGVSTFTNGYFDWVDPFNNATISGVDSSMLQGLPNTAGPYLLRYVTPNCTSSDTSFFVTFITGKLPAPTVTGRLNICNGDSTVLRVAGVPGATYFLHNDSTLAADQTNSTGVFTVKGLSVGTNKVFLKYKSAKGCETYYAEVEIFMNGTPVTPDVAQHEICFNMRDTLVASSPDDPTVDYHWYNVATGGTSIADTNVLFTPPLKNNTTYYVETSINGCPSARRAYTVIVRPVPETPTITGNQEVCVGFAAKLRALVLNADSNNYSYKWYDSIPNPTPPPATPALSSSRNFTTIVFTKVMRKTYYVQSTYRGCKSDLAIVDAGANPSPSIKSITLESDEPVCEGSSVAIVVNPSNTDPDNPEYMYKWFDRNQIEISVVDPTDNRFPTDPLSKDDSLFYVSVSYTNTGCKADSFITFKVNQKPKNITISGKTMICLGGNTQLSAQPDSTSRGFTYKWYYTSKTVTTPRQIQGQNSRQYKIDPVTRDSTVYVRVTSAAQCLSDFIKTVVLVQTVPNIDSISGNAACLNGTATLKAYANIVAPNTSSNIQFNWYNNIPSLISTDNGTYTTAPFGNVGAQTFYVEAINTNASPACKSPRERIKVIVSPLNLDTVTAYCDSATASSIVVRWSPPAGGGAFAYQVSTDNFNQSIVNVPDGENAASYKFEGLASNTPYDFYVRAIKDTTLQNCGDNYGPAVKTSGCATLYCGTAIEMLPDDTIDLSKPDYEPVYVGIKNITGLPFFRSLNLAYSWNPTVDTSGGDDKYPVTPDSTTTYSITVTYNDAYYAGCPTLRGDMRIVVLNPDEIPDVIFPNSFTPNDGKAGHNEFGNPLFINEGPITDYNLSVYSRWGERVFEGTDIKQTWNGKMGNSGPLVPDGVYVYICKIKDGRDRIHIKHGIVTVVR